MWQNPFVAPYSYILSLVHSKWLLTVHVPLFYHGDMKHVLLEMSNAGLVNNMKKYLEAKNNEI